MMILVSCKKALLENRRRRRGSFLELFFAPFFICLLIRVTRRALSV